MEKISIIIPAYIDTEEKQQWLNQSIESAQNQTYKNREIIVIDDCSPIPVEFKGAIRLNKNVGVSVARNTAVHYSTGDLILPLDSDDILMTNALELLYNEYKPNHFIYGNVTLFKDAITDNLPTTRFPNFECRNVLNLGGVFPVTCLHSKESHTKAGGWKSIFKHGLEDVEYWISMVRQCILGINIHKPVLYYRKHPFSRTEKMRSTDNEGKTKSIIRKIHEDLYRGGDMPCSGCGGSKRRKPTNKQSNAVVSTNLLDYPDSMKMTIQYDGPRGGAFGIVGVSTGVSYRIMGTGSQLEIHKDDWGRFKNLDAGKAFSIVTVAQQTQSKKVADYNPSQPEIAEQPKPAYTLEELDLSKNITQMLFDNAWTVEKLATDCRVGDLKDHISGIGPKTELRITERARLLYFK